MSRTLGSCDIPVVHHKPSSASTRWSGGDSFGESPVQLVHLVKMLFMRVPLMARPSLLFFFFLLVLNLIYLAVDYVELYKLEFCVVTAL